MPDDATIIEGDAGFLGMASRLNPLQLPAGMVQRCENMRLDRGVAQTRKGAKRLAESIGNIGEALTVPFQLAPDKSISSITRGGFGNLTATATLTAHGYATDDYVNIRGADQSQYNGNFTITVTGANTFTYTLPADPGISAGSVGLVVGNVVTFSDLPIPSNLSASTSYLISSTPSSTTFYISNINGSGLGILDTSITPGVTKVNFSTGFSYTLASLVSGLMTISGTSLIANRGPVIQNTYIGGIIGAGIYSSPRLDNSNEYIVLAGPNACYLWRDSASLQTIAYPTTDTIVAGDDIEIIQAFDKLYLLRTREESLIRLQTLTQTSGTATATTLGAHPYQTGEVVRISGAGEAGYLADFQVTRISSTQFSFTVPSGTAATATGQIIAQRVQPALVWDGVLTNPFARVAQGSHPLGVTYSRLPSTSTATFLNNQLVIARNRDEVLISDVFDAETYDPVSKSFRANAGSNDYIVALHPYAEGQVLVFCRKSIWLATAAIGADGVSIDPANSSLQLLTDEIGCSARRSIATAGVFVFFLSDNGVYRLDNQFDLKLRGSTQTLSDPIADLIGGINAPAAHLSNGIYFANRYYLALPLGTSTQPNSLFAFNMLNQQWETRDTYGFPIDRLLVSDYGTQRRLFAATATGKLFLLDELESGADDTASGLGSTDVPGLLLSRRYGWGSMNAKRLLRAKASVVLPAGASCTLEAVTQDFDNDFQIAALTNSTGAEEDYTLKAPMRCKATTLDLRWRTLTGRPILRQITAEAARSSMDPTETRTLN
jgi:hypothetical protein